MIKRKSSVIIAIVISTTFIVGVLALLVVGTVLLHGSNLNSYLPIVRNIPDIKTRGGQFASIGALFQRGISQDDCTTGGTDFSWTCSNYQNNEQQLQNQPIYSNSSQGGYSSSAGSSSSNQFSIGVFVVGGFLLIRYFLRRKK